MISCRLTSRLATKYGPALAGLLIPSGSCGVPGGIGEKNGIVSRDSKSGSGRVRWTTSLNLPTALIPEIDAPLPLITLSAPTISCMYVVAGDDNFGSASRLNAYTKSAAWTVRPVLYLKVFQRSNVYVLPSLEI